MGFRSVVVQVTLHPTAIQAQALQRAVGAQRAFYNLGLAEYKKLLDQRNTDPSVTLPWGSNDLVNFVNAHATSNQDYAWYPEVSKYCREVAGENLAAALTNWSDSRKGKRKGRKVGFPRFKKKGLKDTVTLKSPAGAGIRVDTKRERSLVLPRLGSVRVRETHQLRTVRQLTKDEGRITKVTIRYDGKRWTCSILLRAPLVDPRTQHPSLPSPNGDAGVDLGLTTFATVADARGVSKEVAPRPYRKWERKLKRAQRKLNRAQKGSRNRTRRQEEVNRVHARIKHTRTTHLHQLSKDLAKTHSQITLETLNVYGMTRNKRLAKAIGDAAWAKFVTLTEHKCHRYGTTVRKVAAFYPSTQTCSGCGERREVNLGLGDRSFTCAPSAGVPSCGLVMDRDENSALLLQTTPDAGVIPPPVPVVVKARSRQKAPGVKRQRVNKFKVPASP